MERSYLKRNAAERERLRALIERLSDDNLAQPLEGEWTIAAVLASGLRTADIKSEGTKAASTTQMGEAILKELQALHA